MRSPLVRRLLSVALAMCIALPSFSVPQQYQSRPIDGDQKKEVEQAITELLENTAYVPGVDFRDWEGFLAKDQPAIDKATTENEFAIAIGGALHDLVTKYNISHVYLMTPQMSESREHHAVVGIGISYAPDKDGLFVTHVFPDSAADKAGLVNGDLIVGVDGKKPSDATAIRGDEGSTVTIKVKHDDGKTDSYQMVRKSYSFTEAPTLKWIDDKTAVLRVPTFDLSYSPSVTEQLMTDAAKADNLIVDVRGNPGGAVISMLHLLGMLLPPGTRIGTIVSAPKVKEYQANHPGPIDVVKVAESVPDSRKLYTTTGKVPYFKGKVAVLVNAGSGSAAEMVAAALRDKHDATVIGTKSAGAVLVSTINSLPDNFKMQIPICDYVTIAGLRLEQHGVVPDIVQADPKIPGRDKDLPLDKAVAVVEKMDQQEKASAQNNR